MLLFLGGDRFASITKIGEILINIKQVYSDITIMYKLINYEYNKGLNKGERNI